MARHRTHNIAFKRQVAQEFLAGETLHGLSKRHDICRNLIRVWVAKYEAGAFDEDARAATSSRSTQLRSPPWSASSAGSTGARVSKGGIEKRTADEKREYVHDQRHATSSLPWSSRYEQSCRPCFGDARVCG